METTKAAQNFMEAKPDLSLRSLGQYRDSLALLAKECPEMPDGPQPIRRALARCKTVWVRDGHWRVWSSFFRWCATEYEMANPLLKVARPRPPEVEMKSLDQQELALLMTAPKTTRDRAVLALALDSGVRASEFGRVRGMDIGTDTILIQGKGNRQLRVPISPETRQLLLELAGQQRDPRSPIFIGRPGKPLTRFGIYFIVRSCMDKAGIAGPKLGPHCLRHSLGRNYIVLGGDAFTLCRIMRHRSITTTQKYVNLALGDVVQAHHQHSPLRVVFRGAQLGLMERQVEEILGDS